MADGILFSAGTDTSIIAYHAVKYKPQLPALTMAFKHGHPKDTEYVKKMVDFLKLQHQFHIFDLEDVLAAPKKSFKSSKSLTPWK